VDCIQQYADLYKTATSDADLNNAYQQMVTEFDSGSAASMLHNLGSATANQKALGVANAIGAAVPKGADGKLHMVSGSTGGPVIFKASKNQDAAWKWASFLLSHSADSYWNQQAGQLPTNVDARKDSWVADNEPIKNAIAALGSKSTVTVTPPLYLPNWQTIVSGMEPDFQALLLKQQTAKQFAQKWADQLTKAEADYEAHFGKSK
jgi:multiple sugar transport system substrate-binding protein